MYKEEYKKASRKLKKQKKQSAMDSFVLDSHSLGPMTPGISRVGRQSMFIPNTADNAMSDGEPDVFSGEYKPHSKKSQTLSKSFWSGFNKCCQYVQTEEAAPKVPPLKLPVKTEIVIYEQKKQPQLQTLPIPLFLNYPTLQLHFAKMMPMITTANISDSVMRNLESLQLNALAA